jgi:hypothetical protein
MPEARSNLRVRRVATAPLLALLLAAARAGAGGDAIVTDRPGFGESASVVAGRRVQVETGLTWAWVGDGATILDLPQALVRVGVGRSLELRVTTPDWFRGRGPGISAAGWSDTTLGVKWHAAAGGNDFSLRVAVYLGTGSLGWSDRRGEPEGSVSWSRNLSERWTVGATVTAHRLRLLSTTLVSPSVSVGHSLGARGSTFLEYGTGLGQGLPPLHSLDHGYTWLAGPDTQLDVSVGVGLSAAAPDFFVALGFSRRF